MSSTISSGGQTRWRNSYASSAEAKLTLRVNGEEEGVVITPDGTVVQAGFDAPTAVPTIADGGAGLVPEGYYYYRYVYASSRYPFIANAVAGGGEEWPRSSPSSGNAAAFQVTGGTRQVSVTVTYTSRSDVDWIWIYRTPTMATAALALAENAAGNLFYVGRVANNPISVGTVVYTDNAAADTGEVLELDNFSCPLFRYTVFDGFYWWGFGNTTATVVVTLDGTTTFSINGSSDVTEWFSGRDGQTIRFVGITTGGYDGRGNFYFKAVTSTTGKAYVGSDLVTPTTIAATGTTTAYLTAPSTTLYRSKNLNPFSWGRTTVLTDGVTVSDTWAERIGGGIGTGIALIPNERILKLDTEGPQKSYALDLNAADSDAFISTLRTLDEAQSTSSQFSQFPMRGQTGQSTLTSVNAKALQLLSADGQSQIPIGDNVKDLLGSMVNDGDNPDFYHGVFDYRTELNCWFIKTTDSDFKCDTLLYQHSPTGIWGFKYAPISASASIYDAESRDHYTFVGDESGRIGIAFADEKFRDWIPDITATPTATLFLASPTVATMTIPAMYIIDAVSVSAGVAVVELSTTHALQVGDIIQIVSITSSLHGAYVVTDASASVEFSISTPGLPDGAYTALAVTHVYSIPSVLLSESLTVGRYLLYTTGTIFGNPSLGGSTITIEFFANGLEAINIDTGVVLDDFGTTLLGEQMTIYLGATLCSAYRAFTANTPERPKRLAETYATLENTGATRFRYFNQFGTTSPLAAKTPTQDGTGSTKFFVSEPPSTLVPSFGVDIHDVGYSAFRIRDFTHKVTPA